MLREVGFSLLALSLAAVAPDRRVVDVARAGDPASEAAHGYAGHRTTAGVQGGAPFRRTTGWMRYALHAFDDSEVTVVLVFAPGDSASRTFDVVVEDSLVATRDLAPHTASATVEVDVPFTVTKGRAEVSVVLRARGGPTPALREIRILQDHNEL